MGGAAASGYSLAICSRRPSGMGVQMAITGDCAGSLVRTGEHAATREASAPRRKMPRKPTKAARAAARGRAPQDAPLSLRRWLEPEELDSPRRP